MIRSMMTKTVDSFVSFCVYLLCIIIFDAWRSSVPMHYKLLISLVSSVIIIAVLVAQPNEIVKAAGGEKKE